MPGLLDFVPVFQETINRIRSRINADANAGLSPTDPAFLDTTAGGFFWDTTQAPALEISRLWDAIGTEMVAAMFPAYAWGTYLDEHGITVGLVRKNWVPAAGSVTFTGTAGTFIATGTQVAAPQAAPDADPVTFTTNVGVTIPGGGSIDVPVTAVTPGSAGNVAANSITILLSPVGDDTHSISAITNPLASTGGADVESDEDFRTRILLAFQGAQGSGTVADYEEWALAYAGVGNVTVTPIWSGPGTVLVTITDANNKPVSAGVVSGLQALLDPVAGQGRGLAPIGASVTVTTPTLVTANISATIVPDAGYSLTGTGSTIAIQQDINDAISGYIDTLAPGQPVILQHVVAAFFEVVGVHDVSLVKINTVAANLAISSSQVAQTGTITLV